VSTLPAWMPEPHQLALLRACLATKEQQAQEAWKLWRAQADVQRLDGGGYRLLPLLWKRLSAWGVSDPDMGTFKGVYRRTWYANQLAIAQVGRLIGEFAAAGIPTMLLKGAALNLRYYGDPALRPMNDVDLAVPRAAAHQAVALLFQSGWTAGITPLTGTLGGAPSATAAWTSRPRPQAAFDDLYFGVRHAHGFRRQQEVDLHWALFQGQCEPGTDDAMWCAAEPLALGAVKTLTLAPADELLLTLAHAARACPVPTIRWVADALMLIRQTGPALDWERLVESAGRRDLGLIASHLLNWLEREFQPGVAPGTLAALGKLPAGPRRRWAYRIRVSPPTVLTGMAELCYLRRRHTALRHQARAASDSPDVPGFIAFTKHILGAENLKGVARYAAMESIRRMRTPWSGGAPEQAMQ
jgi:hypothetical protein